MILVDTSIWIDHLRQGDDGLTGLLQAGRVLSHPFVVGELALGRMNRPKIVLNLLKALPQATTATEVETLAFIETHSLGGLGIGYVDAALLASTRLTPGAALWSRDRRLVAAAERLDLAASQIS